MWCGLVWYGRLGKVRFDLVLCGLLGQVRFNQIRIGRVRYGSLWQAR